MSLLNDEKQEQDNTLIEVLGDAGRIMAYIHKTDAVSRRALLSSTLNKKYRKTFSSLELDE